MSTEIYEKLIKALKVVKNIPIPRYLSDHNVMLYFKNKRLYLYSYYSLYKGVITLDNVEYYDQSLENKHFGVNLNVFLKIIKNLSVDHDFILTMDDERKDWLKIKTTDKNIKFVLPMSYGDEYNPPDFSGIELDGHFRLNYETLKPILKILKTVINPSERGFDEFIKIIFKKYFVRFVYTNGTRLVYIDVYLNNSDTSLSDNSERVVYISNDVIKIFINSLNTFDTITFYFVKDKKQACLFELNTYWLKYEFYYTNNTDLHYPEVDNLFDMIKGYKNVIEAKMNNFYDILNRSLVIQSEYSYPKFKIILSPEKIYIRGFNYGSDNNIIFDDNIDTTPLSKHDGTTYSISYDINEFKKYGEVGKIINAENIFIVYPEEESSNTHSQYKKPICGSYDKYVGMDEIKEYTVYYIAAPIKDED